MQQRPLRPDAIRLQYRATGNLDARFALHQRYSTNRYGWQRWVFEQFGVPPDGTVLELGCGPAYLFQENADRVPPGWQVTLSDASVGMVLAARQALQTCVRCFHYAVIDAQSIPFSSASFDAVIANHMLYHVPDKERALSEIRRVLKPGGCLYASTVGQDHMRELGEMLQRACPSQEPWAGVTASSFLLENGGALLAPWFAHVHLVRYEDGLLVDAAEPLVAYVRSMGDPRLDPRALDRLCRSIECELAARGAVHITKDSGLFVARSASQRG